MTAFTGVYRQIDRGADHHRVRALAGGCKHNAGGARQGTGGSGCILPRLLDIHHTRPQISRQDQRWRLNVINMIKRKNSTYDGFRKLLVPS